MRKQDDRSRGHRALLAGVKAMSILFIIVGGAVVWVGVANNIEAIESAAWPRVPGVVVESKIVSKSSGGRGSRTQHAEIVYEYEAEGADHRGNRVAIGDFGTTGGGHARQLLARYPEGQAVTVHYRPGEAPRSLLEPGWKPQALFPIALGLGFVGFGGLFFVVARREKRRASQRLEGT